MIGYIEPLPEGHNAKVEFENRIVGNAIPPEFLAACEKGFLEAVNSGGLIGHAVEVGTKGTRTVTKLNPAGQLEY